MIRKYIQFKPIIRSFFPFISQTAFQDKEENEMS